MNSTDRISELDGGQHQRNIQQRLTVPEFLDEEEFFTAADGIATIVGHSDLERAVPNEEKSVLREKERYWLNKPYSFVVIYHNIRDEELRYYAVEPALSQTERELVDFFHDKLRHSIDYKSVPTDASPMHRAEVIRDETINLLKRYNLVSQSTIDPDAVTWKTRLLEWIANFLESNGSGQGPSQSGSVDSVPLPRDDSTGETEKLGDRQVEKLLYYLVRDFIRFDKIDPIKHDENVEDISVDGYHEPVFVYHSQYGQMITNIEFAEKDLDDFVIKLAQTAGKGISKRQPDVDATLADGSRAQLTLGKEISSKGTNFTIRQFKEAPFTPIDLINWGTYDLESMVYLWLALENNKSIIFAGGTASGKTTSLNAVSLFIPSESKIVTIEDTREIEIPQRNVVHDVTRESFEEAGGSDIDEFQLLEDSLRKRPDYIIMGEVRGEEGHTLFQAMNTGHTTLTTFHANEPDEVFQRFTSEPIDVPPAVMSSLDLIATQNRLDVGGKKVRRLTHLVEISGFNTDSGNFTGGEKFSYHSKDDEFEGLSSRYTDLMEEIRRERGWTKAEFNREWIQRKVVLAYLIREEISNYAGVAATIQTYMNAPEKVMALISDDDLKHKLDSLRSMKQVDINVSEEVEKKVPRPRPSRSMKKKVKRIINDNQKLLAQYENADISVGDYSPEGTSDAPTGSHDGKSAGDSESSLQELPEPDVAPETKVAANGGRDPATADSGPEETLEAEAEIVSEADIDHLFEDSEVNEDATEEQPQDVDDNEPDSNGVGFTIEQNSSEDSPEDD